MLPEELKNKDEQTIHDEMLQNAPDDIDLSEGNMYWDHTRPVAQALAKHIEFNLPLAIQSIFPQYASGVHLDYHAEMYGMSRRQALHARGSVVVLSKEDTTVDVGALFVAYGDNENDPYYYRPVTVTEVPADTPTTISLVAVESGSASNMPANNIKAVKEPYDDLEIVGSTEFKGGSMVEDDETLRSRLLHRIRTRPGSGNVADYHEWTKEIDGVGDVYVERVYEGPKTVRVTITDTDGGEAPAELVEKVQNHLDPENKGVGEGKAPIGAHVEVVTVSYEYIDIEVIAVPNRDYNNLTVEMAIRKALDDYMRGKSVIRYTNIIGVVVTLDEIDDLIDLKVNGEKEDVIIDVSQKAARVGELIFEDVAKR